MLKIRGRTWWQKNCKNWSNSRTIEKWNHDSWSDIYISLNLPKKKADNDGLQEIWMHFVKALFIFMSFPILIDLGNESFLGKKMKSNNINTNSDVTTYLSNKVTCNWLMFSWVSHTWGWVKVFCWIKLSKNRGQCPVRNLVVGGSRKYQ